MMAGYDSKREAALDKLVQVTEELNLYTQPQETDWRAAYKEAVRQHSLTLDELREALAQPAQEPVAWGYRNNAGAIYDCISPEAHADEEGDYDVPLYATPPQRPWVGLTDKEAMQICEDCGCMSEDWLVLLDAIEAKLKEKNGG